MKNLEASLYNLAVSLFVLLVVSFLIFILKEDIVLPQKSTVLCPKISEQNDIQINAKNAIVLDIKNNCVLYGKNEEERVPIASITKLVTALVAYDNLEKEEEIKINQSDLALPDSQGLEDGEVFTLDEILKLSLLTSSNDAIHAVKRHLDENLPDGEFTISLMNKKAFEIGMTNTVFWNESGLDENGNLGSLSSAYDVSLLLSHVYKNYPDLLYFTSRESLAIKNIEGKSLIYKNTNPYVNNIPGLLVSKTGYTSESGGSLAILFEKAPLHPIAVVVVGSTKEGRFDDVLTLVSKTIEK